MKKVIRIILLLALIGGGTYYYMKSSGKLDDNTGKILVSGNLELTQVDLSFKTAGKLVELNVREGDTVKQGFVVARLDDAALKEQLARDNAAIASAQSQVEQLQTSIEYQRSQIESDLGVRRAEIAQAQARVDDLLAGSRPQEISQAESAVADAKSWNDMAKLDWDRAQTLFKNEDISRSQYDQARTKLDSTVAQVRQAEQRLALVKEGPRKDEIAAARAQLARAQAAIAQIEANRIEVRRKEQEIAARKAEVQRAAAQAGITKTLLNDTVVAAPIDGVILSKAVEAGEVVAAGTTLVGLGDLDHPWLRAYINEKDLGRIKLGGKVKLTTDSFPGKVYEGKISFIASEAEFTPKQIQTKEERVKLVYRIKVEVDNSHHELKNNMPIDAEIVL